MIATPTWNTSDFKLYIIHTIYIFNTMMGVNNGPILLVYILTESLSTLLPNMRECLQLSITILANRLHVFYCHTKKQLSMHITYNTSRCLRKHIEGRKSCRNYSFLRLFPAHWLFRILVLLLFPGQWVKSSSRFTLIQWSVDYLSLIVINNPGPYRRKRPANPLCFLCRQPLRNFCPTLRQWAAKTL